MMALRHIQNCLDNHTASLIAHALISSRLDYANSVLLDAPQYVTNKLQRSQNALARIVVQSDSLARPSLSSNNFTGSLSIVEYDLSWPQQPIKLSIQTPLTTLLHFFTDTNQPFRCLCSSDQQYLVPTPSTIDIGVCSFGCSAPAIWNAIPLDIRSSPLWILSNEI
jgi:hypothetical protein